FNGSTVREPWLSFAAEPSWSSAPWLQWVHGSRTVVITALAAGQLQISFASMGPRFANRGYPDVKNSKSSRRRASMGPRFANRGYHHLHPLRAPARPGFNGSTVREPWLSPRRRWRGRRPRGFNGSTVREPWLSSDLSVTGGTTTWTLQWVHGSRTVV